MARRVRRGFTLVELLVVIGILLVLLGLGAIGYMHIDKVAAERATRTRFDICAAILNNYEAQAANLNAIDSTTNTLAVYYNSVQASNTLVAPGDVNVGSPNRTAAPITSAPGTPSTAMVLQAMSHVPAVKLAISQIPASALLPNQTPPVIVDGWKNPILYVPSGGLTGVNLTQGTSVPTPHTIVSIDGRPFWVSAGQDGNFQNGDDNLYSTAVVVH